MNAHQFEGPSSVLYHTIDLVLPVTFVISLLLGSISQITQSALPIICLTFGSISQRTQSTLHGICLTLH